MMRAFLFVHRRQDAHGITGVNLMFRSISAGNYVDVNHGMLGGNP